MGNACFLDFRHALRLFGFNLFSRGIQHVVCFAGLFGVCRQKAAAVLCAGHAQASEGE